MNKLTELRRQLAERTREMRGLLDAAEAEKRDLGETEQARYGELEAATVRLQGEIERELRLSNLEGQLASSDGRRTRDDANVGMSADDIRNYSLRRAILAAASNDWRGAELEREASEAVAKQLGREPSSFFMPADVQAERRDLTVGTAADGGYTVATDLLAQNFIQLLRNRMVVQAAGATVLAGLQGDVAIPKQTGGATAYWVAESGAPTESQQAVGQVTLSPKTVGAFTDFSRKLLRQSSLDVEAFVRQDLATALALAIDLAALHGSGASNQPTGIASTSGIGSVAGGTNGLAPTWAHMISLETEVAVDNADVGRLAYITNAKVRGKLKQTPKVSSTDSVMVWEVNDNPINGYRALVSNQVSSALTKGTSSGVCSAIFFGNWNDLLIGMWGGLDILVDPYTHSTSGTVRVVALQSVDIAVRHAESFAAMLDALTT